MRDFDRRTGYVKIVQEVIGAGVLLRICGVQQEMAMANRDDFSKRLLDLRARDREEGVKTQGAYRNGQILADSDDASAWDNYDRYFKFWNISSD